MMKQYKYTIKNLDCANCALKLEQALQKATKINQLKINFLTQKLYFECQEEDKEKILKEIMTKIKKLEPDVTIEVI